MVHTTDTITIVEDDCEKLVETIENNIGDDLWGMRYTSGYKGIHPSLYDAVRAVITFDGCECAHCGNQGGRVEFFAKNNRPLWGFDFSD